MSTNVKKIINVEGKICSENLFFSGLEMDKGIFTTKTRTMIRKEDGSYIPNLDSDNNPIIYYQNEAQCALMMQDTFDVINGDGTTLALNGVQVFQWIAQAMDKNYANGYTIEEE